jgi:hypothetical protein
MAINEGNNNAEKWDFESAKKFMDKAVELSKDRMYDFIGEVARDLGQYHQVFKYLGSKYPELKLQNKIILANCESNCFFNGKKNNIVPSMAIMNLKSNHGWTDRIDNTTKGESTTNDKVTITFNDE